MEDPSDRLRLICQLRGHDSQVWSVRWRPGSYELASCGGRRILIWDLVGPQWVLKSVVLNAAISNLNVSITDAQRNETVNVLEVPLVESEVHERTIRNVAWAPDGSLLAVASFDATASLWKPSATDNTRWQLEAKLEGQENEIKEVAWSPDLHRVASCSRDKSIWIHSRDKEDKNSGSWDCSSILSGHTQVWHPQEEILFSVSYDNTIKIWVPTESGDDWDCLQTITTHTSTVWQVSLAPSGRQFASCSDDKTVCIWEAIPLSAALTSTTSSPGNNYAPPHSKGLQGVHPWLLVQPNIRPLKFNQQLSSMAIHPAAAGGAAQTANLTSSPTELPSNTPDVQNVPLRRCTWVLSFVINGFHERTIYSVAWHPDLDLIATACGDDGVRIFKKTHDRDHKEIWILDCFLPSAHCGDVNSVAWRSRCEEDGTWLLATAGDDKLVKIFKYFPN